MTTQIIDTSAHSLDEDTPVTQPAFRRSFLADTQPNVDADQHADPSFDARLQALQCRLERDFQMKMNTVIDKLQHDQHEKRDNAIRSAITSLQQQLRRAQSIEGLLTAVVNFLETSSIYESDHTSLVTMIHALQIEFQRMLTLAQEFPQDFFQVCAKDSVALAAYRKEHSMSILATSVVKALSPILLAPRSSSNLLCYRCGMRGHTNLHCQSMMDLHGNSLTDASSWTTFAPRD